MVSRGSQQKALRESGVSFNLTFPDISGHLFLGNRAIRFPERDSSDRRIAFSLVDRNL